MALLSQVADEVIPEQSPEVVLSRSGRQVSSLLPCPLVLCTIALDAQVGQKGRGKAHPMQGGYCGPVGAVLVLAQPQQRLTVLEELLHGPAFFVRPNEPGGGECRGIADESEDLPDRPFAREDDVQGVEVADAQPPSIYKAVAGLALGLREDEGFGASPPKQVPAVAAGFELPARLAQAAVALQGGGEVATLFTTGLDHGVAEIVGIKQHHDLDARGGCILGSIGRPTRWSYGRTLPRRDRVLFLTYSWTPSGIT